MSNTKKNKSEEQKKTEKPLMGVCQMIVESTEAFNKLLSDSLNIYDQALYFIRQDFFKKPFEERGQSQCTGIFFDMINVLT